MIGTLGLLIGYPLTLTMDFLDFIFFFVGCFFWAPAFFAISGLLFGGIALGVIAVISLVQVIQASSWFKTWSALDGTYVVVNPVEENMAKLSAKAAVFIEKNQAGVDAGKSSFASWM